MSGRQTTHYRGWTITVSQLGLGVFRYIARNGTARYSGTCPAWNANTAIQHAIKIIDNAKG